MAELPLYPDRTLVEGIAGTWHYHLSDEIKKTRALCGAEVMSTRIPEEAWGLRSHLKERYCGKCAEIRKNSI